MDSTSTAIILVFLALIIVKIFRKKSRKNKENFTLPNHQELENQYDFEQMIHDKEFLNYIKKEKEK